MRSGNPAGLPVEVVQMVIDVVIQDFKRTKDGAALCKLLHTSCFIRATLVKQYFQTVQLFECDDHHREFRHADFHVHLPKAVGHYVDDLVSRLILDFSIRRDTARPMHPKDVGKLLTTFGLRMTTARAELTVRTDVLACRTRGAVTQSSTFFGEYMDLWDVDKTSKGVFEALNYAVRDQSFELRDAHGSRRNSEEPIRMLCEVLRNISPFQRALDGSFNVSSKRGVGISVKLYLQNYLADDTIKYTRSWSFDTLRVREGTVAPELESMHQSDPWIDEEETMDEDAEEDEGDGGGVEEEDETDGSGHE